MKIKNWEKFQQYKDRRPPWIKLHRTLLDDINFFNLSGSDVKHLVLIWLIASEYDGALPDVPTLAFRLRISEDDMFLCLENLIDKGFILESEEAAQVVDNKEIAKRNGFGTRYIKDAVKLEVKQRDKGKCVRCPSVENIEFDHIIPVSKGGSSELDNIQLLCRSCNRSKRNKLLRKAVDKRSLEKETESESEKEVEIDTQKISQTDDLNNTKPKEIEINIPAIHRILTYFSQEIRFSTTNSKNIYYVEQALKDGFSEKNLELAIKNYKKRKELDNDNKKYWVGCEKFFEKNHLNLCLSPNFLSTPEDDESKKDAELTRKLQEIVRKREANNVK